ncbi:DNA modification methylase [Frankineae bacterium MT45]|nr:DNA modification methylase [Frankineae bacterium MT45]
MRAPRTTSGDWRNRVVIGDAATQLAQLADDSVDMVLTSPPYFRLRDYQIEGQLGLEAHVEHWVDELDLVLRGVRRVLKPAGTLWLNLGDSYATHAREGAPRKSLLLGPERVAERLVGQGWALRNKIVWAKTNPMPSSVRDRLSCTWEYLYVFSQQPHYYFDLDAIRVPHRSRTPSKPTTARSRQREVWRGPNGDDASGLATLHARGIVGHPLGKNPGDLWQIASPGYRGAHHATFPVELARRAILAGCPEGGVVLDPFFGAGTTAVAAERLGRDWMGIELSPDFAAIAGQRIHDARESDIGTRARAA